MFYPVLFYTGSQAMSNSLSVTRELRPHQIDMAQKMMSFCFKGQHRGISLSDIVGLPQQQWGECHLGWACLGQ